MTTAVDVFAVLVLFVFVAYIGLDVVGRYRRSEPAEPELEPEVVRVHFADDDRSVEGVLVAVSRDHYRLANAKQFTSPDASVPLDGEAWVPREKVLLVQRL